MRWMLMGLAAVSVQAQAADAPYYGPMKHWRGIGFEQGHKETLETDGSWRVTGATTRGGDAVDIAMYRAAELARAQGFAYVQLLGGSGSRGPGHQSTTLYALPSHSSAPPTACRSKRPGTCYTADVGDLLRILGGADGLHPGVPIVDHLDGYGRQVSYSGFGVGHAAPLRQPAASRASPLSQARTAPPPSRAVLPSRSVSTGGAPHVAAPSPGSVTSYERALAAQRGIHGREPEQGWTIGD